MKKTVAANPDHVQELFLLAENTEILYNRYFFPRGENLQKKIRKGVFDRELAIKALTADMAEVAKYYHKRWGGGARWFDVFSVADRVAAAAEYLDSHIYDWRREVSEER